MQIYTITPEANAFQLYQSVNFYPLSFCCRSSFTLSSKGTNRLNYPEQTHQHFYSPTFSLKTQKLCLISALGAQAVLGTWHWWCCALLYLLWTRLTDWWTLGILRMDLNHPLGTLFRSYPCPHLLLILTGPSSFFTSKESFPSCPLGSPPLEKIAQNCHYNITVWKAETTSCY